MQHLNEHTAQDFIALFQNLNFYFLSAQSLQKWLFFAVFIFDLSGSVQTTFFFFLYEQDLNLPL